MVLKLEHKNVVLVLVRSKGAVEPVIVTPVVGLNFMRGTSQQVDSPVINNFHLTAAR